VKLASLVAAVFVAVAATAAVGQPALARHGRDERTTIGRADWPTYGHDAQRTFTGETTLTPRSVATLARAWSFPTGLAVTATPTVVGGTVYVGSWDGNFYALNLRTGTLRWKYRLDAQPAVQPAPGGPPESGSSGGIVTSSAWFEPGTRTHPDLVLFGGGYTLYALDARTGALYWKHAYPGRPDQAPDPVHDDARIFSSPVVDGGIVIVGIAVEGARGSRGRIVAADLATGKPRWEFVTDVDAAGNPLSDGCGSVWSSGSLLPADHLVVFDVADCHFSGPGPFDESVFALDTGGGRLRWVFHPPRRDNSCDFDFGASANIGVDGSGRARFVGVGGKDGTYYRLDPRTGHLVWSTNVVFGGFAGGFVATTAYDGKRVYGATALGDFGRFERNGPTVCDPSNPRDTPFQEPSVHALDARTGAVEYEASGGASFGPTTVARDMTFNCPALQPNVNIRDARTGTLLRRLDLPVPCWSGIATVGDALVLGTGASYNDVGSGVSVFTPGGAPPAGS